MNGFGLLDWIVILTCICMVESVLLIYIPFKFFKKPARKLNSIIRKGKDVLLLTYDDGRTFIKEVEQKAEEAVLKGRKPDEYYIIAGIPPEKFGSEIIAKRSILEDTGSSVFMGYSGQMTVYTPYIAAAAAAVSMQSNPSGQAKRDEAKDGTVMLFSIQQLKDLLKESFSPASMMEIKHDIEERVRAELAGRRFGALMNFMWIFIGLVVVAIVLKIIGVV